MRTPAHIMLLQIPQIMAFIRIESALRNSRDSGVISQEEFKIAIDAIQERCNGKPTEDWLSSFGTVDSHVRKDFLKSGW